MQEALPDVPPDTKVLASTAIIADADMVIARGEKELALADRFEKLHISIGDWDSAKHNCEVFVRGHEIPWSFRYPAWGTPFSAFYPFVEPHFQALNELHNALNTAARAQSNLSEALEHARSLAFNRLSNICYTRDHLLFFTLQRRAAKRKGWLRQDFAFEAGYFLNHYYLLFWGGLDQICWIVNDVFSLGFNQEDWREVGITKAEFLIPRPRIFLDTEL